MSMLRSQSKAPTGAILMLQQEVTLESAEADGGNSESEEANANDGSETETTPNYSISMSSESHSGTYGGLEGISRGGNIGLKQGRSAVQKMQKELEMLNVQVLVD